MLFLQSPGFAAKAFDAVPVDRPGKAAGADAEAYLHGIGARCWQREVNNTVRKNRKRFSFTKKRFN
ncbi:hypothetical protein CTE07_10590 [Chitinophaga terrae (ex Kim and Jung 2007)]|nr:hypothetical protein CTE07_10590 [Chitinophaga terrae (ex Kim and Jung 2007)]